MPLAGAVPARVPAARAGTSGQSGAGARGLVAFFVLAFALTWGLWIPAGLSARGDLALPVPDLALVVAGGFGPLVAAVVVVGRARGRRGVLALFAQLDPRGVAWRWFLAPLLLAVVGLVPVAAHLASGGRVPGGSALASIVVAFPVQVLFVAVAGGGLDEEVGWRGHALPELLRRCSPGLAHAVLGVLWACWHLPLWLDPAGSHAAYPFGLYVLLTTAQSVLIGWMYCGSGGCLAVAVLAHAMANGADGARYQLLGADRGELAHQLVLLAATVVVAAAVAAATRGRLGADRLSAAHQRAPAVVSPGHR